MARRAAREFGCPRERIGILDRSDVAYGLYDLAACGQRARYMCVGISRCIREPDPPKWDPDPALCFSNDPKQKPAGCDPATAAVDGGQRWYPNAQSDRVNDGTSSALATS